MYSQKGIVNDVTELIGQTPLVRLNKIVDAKTSAEVLCKLESFNPGGSLKDRACLHMIEEAERLGLIKPGSTIIEPTSGNTGIGLAMICAVKGYQCILTMPESMSLERIYLLRLYGAEVILTPTKLGIPGAIKKADELAKKIKHDLQKDLVCVYDDTAAIGKLYRRQDEIGTFFCVTVDVQSLEDRQVTVRDRDTMRQERIAVDRLKEYLLGKFSD